MDYRRLAFMANGLAGTLANRSMHKVVDGENSVVMSLTEAAVWQEELAMIGKALRSMDGREEDESWDAMNVESIRELQDQLRANGFKSQNPAEDKAFLDDLNGDI